MSGADQTDLPGHTPFAGQILGVHAGNLELRAPFTNAPHPTATQGMALTIDSRLPHLVVAVVESRAARANASNQRLHGSPRRAERGDGDPGRT